MSRIYPTWQEEEANKAGHDDERRNIANYDHDKFSDNPEDIAYWEGRNEEKDEIEIERRLNEDDERDLLNERDSHERENFVRMIGDMDDDDDPFIPSIDDEDYDYPYLQDKDEDNEGFMDDDDY
jgi:hypothetical protein